MLDRVLILVMFISFVLGFFDLSTKVDNLNNALANADIRIDICLNEQTMLQDKIEESIQNVRLDVTTLQIMLGVNLDGLETELN